jgi:hypothetical protein
MKARGRCPRCRTEAPLVTRGLLARCAACGAPRWPVSARLVRLAGQPTQLGGRLARLLGWVVLGVGLLLSTSVILLLELLIPGAAVGFAIGLPIALITSVIGVLLLFGSRRLRLAGEDAERAARTDALGRLAARRGGALTVEDAAASLRLGRDEVDALLTWLSETEPERVQLELDDDGNLFYVFTEAAEASAPGVKYRVEPGGRVRVFDPLAERFTGAADAEQGDLGTRAGGARDARR